MNEIRVLHVNSYYSYYGHAGFYRNFYDQQIKDGIDIDVYVPTSNQILNYKDEFGDYTNVVKTYNSFDRLLYHLKQYKMLKKAEKLYKISSYNLVHAHSLFSNGYVAYHLKRKYKLPYIVALRDTDINVFFKKMPMLRSYGIRILEEAEKIVFLSESYKKTTFDKYIPTKKIDKLLKKTVVIPNGIDKFWLNNKFEKRRTPDFEKEINLLFVGNISKRKNPSTTVRACEILKGSGYSAKLTIAGPIEHNDEYKKIEKSDLVNYVGKKTKDELLELYQLNHIFVMPSITETFGLVYAEAMSQGLPLIYTRDQGFDGQFSEGTVGYSVDCNAADEIADRIIKITQEYQSIYKNCINLSSQFSWDKISSEYFSIYKNISTKNSIL